ncbi:MAG: 4-hydroxy-3-methylbut-2-enyl diphosphate reductase [Candidatus Brocadia sp. AMX2]|nr:MULTISPECIES: 4-hydroxy-3-methylbut-2-enyl diphosphate reductase [Brocadia]KXK27998.1 MAG: putative hydroxymethylbutenyl pyrophosphate reductase [Candidatus Brocadia sinica]NOG43085.1 4-hydroxy-3-methylbut-2-enyl diphosphate reductase [Planctomycetota bacterium]MCE7868150.1 4-hydroxy-3-methylbut-2-enyl diphosphate reductase [Candidatus Brocadia sp. AMX2]MCK6469465.1 4-hydroxy-3-methylbut-2-enyl diphosphate reductase [Candidatus Brocadia sinica]MDL1936323.1 4-hydroxy-3-methylbut-2-enyl dipho
MRVKVAKTAGFCMGVRRAMDILLDAANEKNEDGKVFTDGPLIHNPQVLEYLEKRGIHVVNGQTDLSKSTVVIRAHGITPARRKEIENMGAKVCDATCPHVMRVQSIIKKYAAQGYSTVIVGDKGHAEVIGLLGYAEGKGHVVQELEEIEHLPPMDKVCIVAQTTQDRRLFKEAIQRLKKRYSKCESFETICSSTYKRQDEVISLSKSVDAMIVVGGRGSANTARLVKICESQGTPTFHVETDAELDLSKLRDYDTVGVTAGASTPNWMIKRVVEKVHSYKVSRYGRLFFGLKSIASFFIGSCTYSGLGAASLGYASAALLGVQPRLSFCLIAAFFIFSMQVLNHFANKEAVALNEPARAKFYEKRQTLFIGLGITGAVASFILGFILSKSIFFCIFLASLFGIFYRLEIIPKSFSRVIRYRSLEQIPGSKEIFYSIAWAVSTALIPFLGSKKSFTPSLVIAIAFAFSLAFIRAVVLDIRDIQGDRILGKETIPIAIGKERTKTILLIIIVLVAVLLSVSPLFGWTTTLGYYLLPCVAYASGYQYLLQRKIISEGLLPETVADFNFIFSGIMAFVWKSSYF